jgi:hypothetical protein
VNGPYLPQENRYPFNNIPGSTGYIPGKYVENVIAAGWKSSNQLATRAAFHRTGDPRAQYPSKYYSYLEGEDRWRKWRGAPDWPGTLKLPRPDLDRFRAVRRPGGQRYEEYRREIAGLTARDGRR